MKNLRKTYLIYFALLLFFLTFQIQPLLADENDLNESPDSGKITNAAQEQHAQNLAEAAALQDSGVSSFKEYLGYAERELEEAKRSGDEEKIEQAQIAYDSAKASFEETLAKETVSQREDIAKMRQSGMGWGEIAHKLGVHTSVLGLGHAKKQVNTRNRHQAREEKQKTSQSLAIKSDKGKGLGFGHSKGYDGKGKGKGSHTGHGGSHGGGHGDGGKK